MRAVPAMGEPIELPLVGWGTACADLEEIAQWRRQLPAWAPSQTPQHFLKHADEQTVAAVAAVDRAITALGLSREAWCRWPIVAAPQGMGRIAGAATLSRFARGGGPTVSPHLIPQHSLHSISGALSILLGSRAPNLGVSGGHRALEEGLLTLLTLGKAWDVPGAWLVATAFEPTPCLAEDGECLNRPLCWAAALAWDVGGSAGVRGCLRLHRLAAKLTMGPEDREASRVEHPLPATAEPRPLQLPELVRALDAFDAHGQPLRCVWRPSDGLMIEWTLPAAALAQRAAA